MVTQNYNRVEILYNSEHKPYLYGAVHIIDGDLNSQRLESPFVISKQKPSGEEAVYGTVTRMLEKVVSQINRLNRFQLETAEKLRAAGIAIPVRENPVLPESELTARILDEQEDVIEEVLLTVSVNIRILSEIFSKKLRRNKVSVYDYEDNLVGEIELSRIADLLVHNRYICIRNQYVVDLVSDEKFLSKKPQMGLKVDILEYFSEVEKVVNSITVKDLVGVLWGLTEKLSASSNIRDIIFLTQNLYTLGGLTVGVGVPIEGPLKTILDRVARNYIEKMYSHNSAPMNTPIKIGAAFSTPRFFLEPELDRKQIRIKVQVNGNQENLVMDYKDFFGEVSRSYGNRKLYESSIVARSRQLK